MQPYFETAVRNIRKVKVRCNLRSDVHADGRIVRFLVTAKLHFQLLEVPHNTTDALAQPAAAEPYQPLRG